MFKAGARQLQRKVIASGSDTVDNDVHLPLERKFLLRRSASADKFGEELSTHLDLIAVGQGMLPIVSLEEVLGDNHVEILAAELSVSRHSLHLKLSLALILQDGDVESAAAEIENEERLGGAKICLLVARIRDRGRGGLGEQPEHVESGDLRRSARRLLLRLAKVGWDRHNRFLHHAAKHRFRRRLHFLQYEGRHQLNRPPAAPLPHADTTERGRCRPAVGFVGDTVDLLGKVTVARADRAHLVAPEPVRPALQVRPFCIEGERLHQREYLGI
mmetsp:Transcript_36285/g.116872  ORF Transcript_36285/g.116872 Transcript_36285/m.116872 type:complete len:273 (+) Transcript_36285:1471-2289(+)